MKFQCTECGIAYDFPRITTGTQMFCSDPACSGELEPAGDQKAGELTLPDGRRVDAAPGIILGRGTDASVRLLQSSVAERHAQILGDEDSLSLRDLDSPSGTFVNGVRIVEKSLRDGDRIKLGDVELRFSSAGMRGEGMSLLDLLSDDRTVQAESRADGLGGLQAASQAQVRLVKALAATASFASYTDEPALVDHLLDRVFEIFPAERAAVLLNHEQLRRRRTIARTRTGEPLDEAIAMSRSLAKKVLEERIAMVVSDAAGDSRMPNLASVIVKGLRSILVAPIAAGDKVLGLLWADSLQRSAAFTSDDLPVFSGLAAAAGNALTGIRHSNRIRTRSIALSRLAGSVPQQMIPQIMTRRVTMPAAGAQREVTVLFCELLGFSAVSDTIGPEETVETLNGWLGRMTEVIHEHGGMVDRAMGDSVLALWGMPEATAEDPAKAVRTALAMQQALDEMNRERASAGRLPLQMGIGIHTGLATVGNIGGPARMAWSAVGTTVKLASRIESTAAPGEIRISESTRQHLGEQFRASPLPAVRLHESEPPLPVFSVQAQA